MNLQFNRPKGPVRADDSWDLQACSQILCTPLNDHIQIRQPAPRIAMKAVQQQVSNRTANQSKPLPICCLQQGLQELRGHSRNLHEA
jgi:hypothetical protein